MAGVDERADGLVRQAIRPYPGAYTAGHCCRPPCGHCGFFFSPLPPLSRAGASSVAAMASRTTSPGSQSRLASSTLRRAAQEARHATGEPRMRASSALCGREDFRRGIGGQALERGRRPRRRQRLVLSHGTIHMQQCQPGFV